MGEDDIIYIYTYNIRQHQDESIISMFDLPL